MIHLDDLIERLQAARDRHGNPKCGISMCDGSVLIHCVELPDIQFHQQKGGDFMQIVFYVLDDKKRDA